MTAILSRGGWVNSYVTPYTQAKRTGTLRQFLDEYDYETNIANIAHTLQHWGKLAYVDHNTIQ